MLESKAGRLRVEERADGFDVRIDGTVVLEHWMEAPAFFLGRGRADVVMSRGNFTMKEQVEERIALRFAVVEGERVTLSAEAGGGPMLTLSVEGTTLALHDADAAMNRLWVRTVAEPGERLWGGGEQMSYFDLAGRRFPLWTSEPGVGRDKATKLTQQADASGGAGGDYWTTSYPQPTYVSSRHYALHMDTTAYSCFDFRDAGFHEIEVWEVPRRLEFFAAKRFAGLVSELSERFGRPKRLPSWVYAGAVLGFKQGMEGLARMERLIAAGAAVTAVWCEDWAGVRETSFGRRLFWDWRASDARYLGLRATIAALRSRGIRFLNYINPYLATDGVLYGEALSGGHLVRRLGVEEPYLVDFGEFDCGLVDFTSEAAAAWFAERVIAQESLDLGVSGWMADFGEYLPVDVRLADGSDGMLGHNAWPVLWAKVNADAIASRGKTGEAIFFMRAGFTGASRYCPMLWAGDQSVDFSRHDGIGTVLRAMLSSGMLGNAYHHSDIGGYTSLFGNVRTAELLMRWSELAAFSPMMRSHEGNRPEENLQIDSNAEVLEHFVRMTKVHAALAPYVEMLCDEAVATGLPLQRAIFLDYEDDPRCWGVETQFCYGRDLLVAPVIEAEARMWEVYLPAGVTWVHLWSAKRYEGGAAVVVEAGLGEPPVFYREDSAHAALFAEIGRV